MIARVFVADVFWVCAMGCSAVGPRSRSLLCKLLRETQIEEAEAPAIRSLVPLTPEEVDPLTTASRDPKAGCRLAMRKREKLLDQVIQTMYQTGHDMQSRYKETSLGGLALSVIEC